MSTTTSATPNVHFSPASSNLLQAPPPTRINSPPPAPRTSLNDIDLSSGPPLSLDSVGGFESSPDEKTLPPTPHTTRTRTCLTSSSSIALVIVSPPESNHGSPVVSPYISPSNTSAAASSSPALPFSRSFESEEFESVERTDTTPSSNAAVSASEHLSEDWHPRGESTNEPDQTDVGPSDQSHEGEGTSPSCYSLNSATRGDEDQGTGLSEEKRADRVEKTSKLSKKSHNGVLRRLTRMLNFDSK